MKLPWIKVDDQHGLPRDGKECIALWKGRLCIAQCDTDENRFYICFGPADGSSWQIAQDREHKFTHYLLVDDLYPEDY